MEKASVLLLDGDLAGITLLHQLADGGEALQAVAVDLGQRSAAQSCAAAQAACEPLGVELVRLDLAAAAPVFRNVQQRRPASPIPHAPLIAHALAHSYALNLGSPRLYLAVTRDDAAREPACSHAALAQFRLLAGLLGDVALATPYLDLGLEEVATRGRSLQVDYAQSWSCVVGLPVHCGRCGGCARRQTALRAAGIDEPAGFYRA